MFKKIGMMVAVMLWSGTVFAAHPLVTDDTGTQGRGNFQLEVNGEYAHDDEEGATEDAFEVAAVLSYGLSDRMDIVFGVPYQDIKTKDSGTAVSENGVSDSSIELKWRFYEEDGLSLALKPGVTLPTGDEEKGLGAGKTTYSMFFIATKDLSPWTFHLNLGYGRNENTIDEREDVWHASLASERQIAEDVKAVADIGIERNPDKASNTHPAFILGGLIYSVSENIDLDIGVKGGLNKPEADYSILAGTALRF